MTYFENAKRVLYHCTTPKKLARYKATGCILAPVRGWIVLESAKAWCKQTGRTIILKFEVSESHPLPDHKPRGHAYWTPELVRNWEIIEE
jgi:hypothetical protein